MPKRIFGTIGYTLVEILVSLSIISILFGAGYLSYRDFSRKQYLNSFTEKLKSDLILAREKAIAGEKPEECTGSLNGYNFGFYGDSYQIVAVCSNDTLIKSVEIPSDLEVTAPATNPILFKVLNKGTNLTGLDQVVTIKQTSTNKQDIILIRVSGEIR